MNNNYRKKEFKTIYEEMLVERRRLEQMIYSIQQQIKTLPNGTLSCVKTGKYSKWYCYENQKVKYLSKKERGLAEQLAYKKYLKTLLTELNLETSAIEAYLKVINLNEIDFQSPLSQLLLDEDSPFKELLSNQLISNSQKIQNWQNMKYDKNMKYQEQLQIKTVSGNMVRSKSEAMIDSALFYHHIPFRYECALSLGNKTLYPDFTILNSKTNELVYWEHHGMMDDTLYAGNTSAKLQLYMEHDIIPNVNLITTYEDSNHPLSSITVEKIIQVYF